MERLMKKIMISAFVFAVFGSSIIFANTTINKEHSGLTKDGANVNCSYCHTTAGIPKQAGNKAQSNTNTFCLGSECHPR
jgi:hypothetical protein